MNEGNGGTITNCPLSFLFVLVVAVWKLFTSKVVYSSLGVEKGTLDNELLKKVVVGLLVFLTMDY